MKTSDIRRRFLEFFTERQHRLVESSPLVPMDDPTLLFTTAGMVPFKRFYEGTVEVPYRRATSCQKCLRVKGKASDLENVGRTVRHMTFFEMLGNFSFGDYFKREAIAWAWEFSTQVMHLPADRIWVSIFEEDDEAGEIWRNEIGFPAERLIRMGRKDNFWGPAGETGACGPCSELLFDRGEKCNDPDIPPGEPHTPANDELRFLEFWNLVFPQYDYIEDNPKRPLKNRGIDTGMGLERLAMLVQGTNSVFETNELWPVVEHFATLVDRPYIESHEVAAAMNACVDHARCLLFAISEGIIPSNEGRGYVMRAIIRRAIRLCKTKLHFPQPVLFNLVDDIVDNMGDVYPQIKVGVQQTRDIIRHEEERFLRTVDKGQIFLGAEIERQILNPEIDEILARHAKVLARDSKSTGPDLRRSSFLLEFPDRSKVNLEYKRSQTDAPVKRSIAVCEGSMESEQIRAFLAELPEKPILSGETVFSLYDTYGFPFEMTMEIADDAGFDVDVEAYRRCMQEQRARARAAWKGAELAESEKIYNSVAERYGETEFTGYDSHVDQADVIALMHEGRLVEELTEGQEGEVILTQTPFYAEQGGQIGDTGTLTHGEAAFAVSDTQRTTHGLHRHLGRVTAGSLCVGQVIRAEVEDARRKGIRRNHSATHLLNAALRKHLGSHIKQAGSLVTDSHLRFDFTHGGAIDTETIASIEATVADHIMADYPVGTEVLPIAEARTRGAVAVFGEKYGEIVRVLTMGPESTEFCGGTHVERTGEIGAFVITSESSIAAGTRRIEAMAGVHAVRHLQQMRERQERISRSLSVKPDEIEKRLVAMQDEIKAMRREMQEIRQQMSASAIQSAGSQAVEISGVRVIAQRIDAASPGDLRNAADVARQGKDKTFVVLAAVIDDKVSLITAKSADCPDALHAGKIMQQLAAAVGGKGGGRPDMAQGGGKDTEKLDEVLSRVPELIEAMLG